MSRDDGFAIADIDTGYFDDAKARDLWQRLRDPDRMARAVVLHKATLLASWRHGERVTATQACPMWMTADDDLLDALKAVKYLDRAGKIPVASWSTWFDAAFARREARRGAGRLGGLASGQNRAIRAHGRSTSAERPPKHPSTDAEPVRPSVRPSVRPGGARAREGDDDGVEDRQRDPADDYWTITGTYPNDKARAWIDDLTEQYGSSAVTRAMVDCHLSDGTARSLLGRVKVQLERQARKLDLAEREAEKRRIVELRKPTVLRVRPDDISDEEADRIAREHFARAKAADG